MHVPRRLFSLLAALAVAVPNTVAAAAARPHHAHVIRIGAVVAQSGAYAAEGRETRMGYELWRDAVNRRGGILIDGQRYRIEISFMDDGSNPNVTAQMTQRLIDVEHVAALLGPYGSAETLSAAAVAERRSVPLVGGAGALEKIYDQGYRYTFGVMSPARKYFTGILEFAVTRRPRPERAAIIAAEDDFSLEVQQGAIQEANDHGIDVVIADRYPSTTANFTALARRIAQAHVDLVLDATHAGEAIPLHRALADNNVRAKLYGYTVGPDTPEFTALLGAYADEVTGSAQWSASVPDTGGGEFYRTARAYAAAFRRRYHHQANYHNAAASAAGLALELAIIKAHGVEPAKVRRMLADLNVTTFFGRIAFDERGVNIYKSMVVNQIQHGKLVTVYPKRAAQAKPVYPATPWQAR